jgi:hypothetical protein
MTTKKMIFVIIVFFNTVSEGMEVALAPMDFHYL